MRFRRAEQELTVVPEPQVLGVEIDPASADLYAEFAEGQSFDQVYALWKDPEVTNPTIRQRAVAALTAPRDYNLPYPRHEQSIGRLLHITEEVKGEQTNSLRHRIADKPELANELARGVLYWLKATGEHLEGSSTDSRDYQSAIKQLLPVVDEETADELFSYYALNDIDPYYDMDSASGYQPLMSILHDLEIPSKYKNMGLVQWIEIANQEEQGIVEPREEHERAIKKMAEFVEVWTYGEGIDGELHTKLIAFLESRTPANKTFIQGFRTRQVAEHITNEDVCFSFAWRHVFNETEDNYLPFKINDDKDLALVKWIIEEANKREMPQFDAKVDTLLQEYEARRTERSANQIAEVALLERLRA